ncbi:MAG: hypothetical protein RLZZ612_932 [Pseudomonadota bacterium]|jgi:3-phosphoshikimate 1-carboxyvinyltransferase
MFKSVFLDLPPLSHAGGHITLPGSKSISNRVLLLSALCEGVTAVHDLLDSDDTRVMLDALRALGCEITGKITAGLHIRGLGRRLPIQQADLFLGNAGTAMRPLTAALALLAARHGGAFHLRGIPRMHERPIRDLVDALRDMGCVIACTGQEGYPPLRIGTGSPTLLDLRRPLQVRGDVSSQFLTALLLALPLVSEDQDLHIDVVGELISKPYIDITLKLLERFGVRVIRHAWSRFTIPAGSSYRSPERIHVEGDASSASYFIALGALAANPGTGSSIRIQGTGSDSIQGDIRFVEAAAAMGARITQGPNSLEIQRDAWPLRAITLDSNHIPDAAMTLAVMALYAQGTTRLTNIASWRVKETDRIAAMAAELRKLGAYVEEGLDWIAITPPATVADWKAATIETYDDHRMAMCFSLAAFNPAHRPIRILDPKCVAKTFPDYFETLFSVAQSRRTQDIPVITIDGPTASGKGTLATEIASELGYHVLDSGALYRLVVWQAHAQGLSTDLEDFSDTDHVAQLADLARHLDVQFLDGKVILAGQEVTDALRTETVGMGASRVATLEPVRAALLERQRAFRQLPGLVADGRDMGTVVFPDASLKVFLTANARQRAQRRYHQLRERQQPAILEDLLRAIEVRDQQDTHRAHAPLKAAKDACLLDNSTLTVAASVKAVLDWWQAKQPFSSQPSSH